MAGWRVCFISGKRPWLSPTALGKAGDDQAEAEPEG